MSAVIAFSLNWQKTCNKEYFNAAKKKKNINNIEICIKENNVKAAILLSTMYVNGDKVNKNFAKAIEVLERFAQSGHTPAIIKLANLLSCYSNQYRDLDRAESLYTKSISKKDDYSKEGSFELARFYIRNYFTSKEKKYVNLYMNQLNEAAKVGTQKRC
jgi:TPR repeat protein